MQSGPIIYVVYFKRIDIVIVVQRFQALFKKPSRGYRRHVDARRDRTEMTMGNTKISISGISA